jgi:hypothetical protein
MSYERREYHATHADWRSREGGACGLKGDYIGIELELESNNYRRVLSAMPEIRGKNRPHVETDGSLSMNGLEIIFPPFRYGTVKKKNSAIHKVMEALKSVVHTTPSTGMHINVNTHDWDEDKIYRFVSVFHLLKKQYLEKLGGRSLNSYCDQVDEDILDFGVNFWERRDGEDHDFEDLLKLKHFAEVMSEHSFAAEISENRVELRFPSATTNQLRLASLVDLVRCVEAFIQSPLYLWDLRAGMPFERAKIEMTARFEKYLKKSKRYNNLYMIMTEGFLEYEQSVVNPSTPAPACDSCERGIAEVAIAA